MLCWGQSESPKLLCPDQVYKRWESTNSMHNWHIKTISTVSQHPKVLVPEMKKCWSGAGILTVLYKFSTLCTFPTLCTGLYVNYLIYSSQLLACLIIFISQCDTCFLCSWMLWGTVSTFRDTLSCIKLLFII